MEKNSHGVQKCITHCSRWQNETNVKNKFKADEKKTMKVGHVITPQNIKSPSAMMYSVSRPSIWPSMTFSCFAQLVHFSRIERRSDELPTFTDHFHNGSEVIALWPKMTHLHCNKLPNVKEVAQCACPRRKTEAKLSLICYDRDNARLRDQVNT